MRPLVSPSVALAAAALTGTAVAAGLSSRSTPERATRGASAATTSGLTSPRASIPFQAPGCYARTPAPPGLDDPATEADRPTRPEPREFFFTRAIYSGYRGGWGGWGRRGSWSIDYPKADRQFISVFKRLIDLDAYDCENAVRLDDPRLRRFPFLYALEVGRMSLTDEEVQGLRDYLMAGGFLVIDDFWGRREWANFEYQIGRVLPEREIVELPMDHPIFDMVYEIEEVLQVPNVRNGRYGGPYWESGGRTPHVRGIHDDEGRLMVVINFNTDLGDAWEWAEDPFYPLDRSTFAMEIGVNMIVYGMSH